MKFFLAAVASLSTADCSFSYTWQSGDDCACNAPVYASAAQIGDCIAAATAANCGYDIIASWIPATDAYIDEGIAQIPSGEAYFFSKQFIVTLGDEILSHGLVVPKAAKVEVETDMVLGNVSPPIAENCQVTPGTYASPSPPVPPVTPLEEGVPTAGDTFSFSFMSEQANYILITSESYCDLPMDEENSIHYLPYGSKFEYHFTVYADSSKPQGNPTTTTTTTATPTTTTATTTTTTTTTTPPLPNSGAGLIVAGYTMILAAALIS